MRVSVIIGVAVAGPAVLAAVVTPKLQAATGQNACEALRAFHQPDVTIVEFARSLIPAGQVHKSDNLAEAQRPATAYCRVEARIEGNIGFLAWLPLPEDWNGRVPRRRQWRRCRFFRDRRDRRRGPSRHGGPTTDAGHQGNTDPLWAMSRKKMEDYTHRAQHLTAVLGRDLTAAYYGKDPSKSYFMGCSGGGRQAQKEMQTFPDDYDGIVAGAPASQHAVQMARKQWIVLAQEQQPEAALSEPQWDSVQAEVVKQCDAADGLTDGLVGQSHGVQVRRDEVGLPAGETAGSCLTPAQIGMVNLMYGPFKDENGVERGPRPILGIRPLRAAPVTGVQAFGQAVHQNPNWTRKDLNIAKDVDALNRILPEM